MVRCALVGLVWFGLSWAMVWADDDVESPAVVHVIVPPAPALGPALKPPAENLDQPTTTSTESNTTAGSAVEPVPLTVPEDPAEIVVPSPNEGNEVIIEEGNTLDTESSETDECWPRPLDFSQMRWWPGQGRTEWIPGHRDRFGMLSFSGESVEAWENWEGLSSTSGMAFHFLDGPVSSDLPSRLFDFTWGLHWGGEMMPGLSASLSAKVGLYTDFEDSVRDGWRFPAHAVFFHDWTETIQTAVGVEYFDRENLQVLPVAGLTLRPDDSIRVEAVFPEPRIAWRVNDDGESENWLSVSGQIGGGQWAIERANTDLADVVTYNDYGLVLGFHGFTPGKSDQAFELGYLFVRDLEYRSGVGNMEPDNTLFLRLSSRY